MLEELLMMLTEHWLSVTVRKGYVTGSLVVELKRRQGDKVYTLAREITQLERLDAVQGRGAYIGRKMIREFQDVTGSLGGEG